MGELIGLDLGILEYPVVSRLSSCEGRRMIERKVADLVITAKLWAGFF